MLTLYRRITDRARWELREWRTPSAASFLQEELDRALLDAINWRPRENVLDVGCAKGAYLDALHRRGTAPTGIDISLAALQDARRSGRPVVAASGLALPFAANAFDTVICHKTMHLFQYPETVVSEFDRVLCAGGRVIFSTSNRTSPYARFKTGATGNGRNANWGFSNRWSATDWCHAFARRGLRTRSFFSCNLVWPLVYRICDLWLIPNKWMRRYNRWVRRISRMPLRTDHPHGAAMDYVVELVKHAQRR